MSSTTSSCTLRSSASCAAGARGTPPSTSARSGRDSGSVPPAAGFGPSGRDSVCLGLELVRQRLEDRDLSGAVRDRLRQQPVGQPRVPRQQGPMQVGPDRATAAAALVPALAVVAEARDDAAEGFGTLVEDRPPRVILEAGESAPLARLELALEEDVADHAPRARERVQRQEPDAGQLVAALVTVEAAEQLVAAADGEKGSAGLERGVQRRAQLGEPRCD